MENTTERKVTRHEYVVLVGGPAISRLALADNTSPLMISECHVLIMYSIIFNLCLN